MELVQIIAYRYDKENTIDLGKMITSARSGGPPEIMCRALINV